MSVVQVSFMAHVRSCFWSYLGGFGLGIVPALVIDDMITSSTLKHKKALDSLVGKVENNNIDTVISNREAADSLSDYVARKWNSYVNQFHSAVRNNILKK
eukprot:c21045_g1_i5.p1 GENE.c21045_g1_i5~~c21045_g1_i5.p1  ORF type:complete len:112 (+),score=37.47 c21045_g1_i5:39-338(+)